MSKPRHSHSISLNAGQQARLDKVNDEAKLIDIFLAGLQIIENIKSKEIKNDRNSKARRKES